jgi:two-component system, OmpR family, response regulator MtrA
MLDLFKRKTRVLVLDDDVAIQKLVSMLLKRDGHRVDVVNRGSKAIEAMEKVTYSAVLLDLMMPTEGGMTVLRHLRETKPEMLKRVILLTGTPKSVLKNVASEVFAVVTKPFEADQLVATVRKLASG